jgi:hypothetical protein
MKEPQPPIRAKHFCNPGDLISSMAGLKAYYEYNDRQVILSQQLNVPASYYPGATHGTVSDDNPNMMVCMNQKIFDMMRPLVVSQDYIADMDVYEGQEDVIIDIDVIRKQTFVNIPHGQIQSWIIYAYPDLAYNLSRPWIELPDKDLPIIDWIKDKIIVNFTERYRNAHISYFFLRKYKHRLIFAGTEREYLLFTNAWKIDMPKLEVKDFLEYAYALKHCKFLLSNQSMGWNLAEALKSPRVLELCEFAPNCMPFVGEKSYGFYHQTGLEHYVDILTT